MAISGELGISAILGSCPFKHHSLGSSLKPSKVTLKGFNGGGSSRMMIQTSFLNLEGYKSKCHCSQPFGIAENSEHFPGPLRHETEGFLLHATNMSFFERLNLAWKIVFPSPSTRRNSNAKIAKQRLQMILFSDRCAVTDDAKEKDCEQHCWCSIRFRGNRVTGNVQLSVSTDEDLGTVYSVTIPVRRVKPEYHQDEDDVGGITNDEYKDIGEQIGSY
ncbi:cell division topological specificity factor homolog chloroplastic [Prunus yedoensis var. nudiflora]|uniref:Cell division topological specificity factor homolog chloroplastic n=1 Tax=Prunus yedoensis var. nudiflora TaxID=2094558 RepID=A0A314XXT0_PRUYE|nr:cell division topological specificity factor homolog chloroplastic [Prunus yedoensis var. nudiflora]